MMNLGWPLMTPGGDPFEIEFGNDGGLHKCINRLFGSATTGVAKRRRSSHRLSVGLLDRVAQCARCQPGEYGLSSGLDSLWRVRQNMP
jgi:hypothetical protein